MSLVDCVCVGVVFSWVLVVVGPLVVGCVLVCPQSVGQLLCLFLRLCWLGWIFLLYVWISNAVGPVVLCLSVVVG